MKRNRLIAMPLIASSFLAACGGTADNKPLAVNTNTSTAIAAKPGAIPSMEVLMSAENQAWESWKAKNGKYFEDYLMDDLIAMGSNGRLGKSDVLKRVTDPTCEVITFSLVQEQKTALGTDAALLTYKATQEAKCSGKQLPLAVWAATVIVRSGDKWKAAYHNEVPIADPKTASTKPADKQVVQEKDAAKSAAPDANTEAMLKQEKEVWEAWKDHDGEKLKALTAKEISFVNIFGTFFPNKTAAIKDWSATGCEVTSVSVTDAVGTMIAPNVGILTFKGGAEGTCFGQKVPPIWGTSIYVKDGVEWKWTYGMNVAAE